GWPIVDRYRDIIRSVAAYTINGRNTCTGFLVNNTNQDGTPFFMTADHCNVTTARAPSLVAYWNYENSFCRDVTPGSGDESGGSNGRRNIFNSGGTLLATYPSTDFTLLLLDDPVPAAANAFYAGWSAELSLPRDTVICVHHPRVQEKRISFSFQRVFRTFSRGGGDPDPNGNHIEVPDWDIGTTEGGSSGSPIFDRFGRVRGQLFGGDAACNNDFYDVYGFFHSSWTGGGTPDSRLSDWLDPCGTGQITIDGFDSADFPTSLLADIYCRGGCNAADNSFTFTLGDGFPEGTTVTATGSDAGLNPQLSASSAEGGQTLTVTVPANSGLSAGEYEITVTAGNGSNAGTATFFLDLIAGSLTAPTGPTPVNNATDVDPLTDLAWTPVSDAIDYEIELATDAGFQ
ncbi:MAG: trypsin-like peptidase domain-containing protein, partial [Bacteroidota bacterium]